MTKYKRFFNFNTSTVNVAFTGEEILGGDEESHQWPDNHWDVYSSYRRNTTFSFITI
jgi:hypothetical protein